MCSSDLGDPISHSKSPSIHRFWLEKLGLEGDYRARKVGVGEFKLFLEASFAEANWRGCNVTLPLKQMAAELGADPDARVLKAGAANLIVRAGTGLRIGNTDVEAIAAVLDPHVVTSPGNRVCMIGAGGAARAALTYLEERQTTEVSIVARDPGKARGDRDRFAIGGGTYSFEQAEEALASAEWIINASPLGMHGFPAMPDLLLRSLHRVERNAVVFDMVYAPLETGLLRQGRALGLAVIDGLDMLIAQAAPSFQAFFGAPPPREHDAELRALLTA